MGLMTCGCLNVKIQVNSDELIPADLTAIGGTDQKSTFFQQHLGIAKINEDVQKEYSVLVSEHKCGAWLAYHCDSCQMWLYGYNSQLANPYLLNLQLWRDYTLIEALEKSADFSKLFNIVLRHQHLGATATYKDQQCQHILDDIQQKLSQFLTSEEREMKSRIRNYEAIQRQQFETLKQKSCKDKEEMVYLILKAQSINQNYTNSNFTLGGAVKRNPQRLELKRELQLLQAPNVDDDVNISGQEDADVFQTTVGHEFKSMTLSLEVDESSDEENFKAAESNSPRRNNDGKKRKRVTSQKVTHAEAMTACTAVNPLPGSTTQTNSSAEMSACSSTNTRRSKRLSYRNDVLMDTERGTIKESFPLKSPVVCLADIKYALKPDGVSLNTGELDIYKRRKTGNKTSKNPAGISNDFRSNTDKLEWSDAKTNNHDTNDLSNSDVDTGFDDVISSNDALYTTYLDQCAEENSTSCCTTENLFPAKDAIESDAEYIPEISETEDTMGSDEEYIPEISETEDTMGSDEEYIPEIPEQKKQNIRATRNRSKKKYGKSHDQTEFQCDVCQKCFDTKRKLSKHGRAHVPKDKFFCEYCGSGFAFEYIYRNHVELHLWKENFVCKKCAKQFLRESQLSRHVCVGNRRLNKQNEAPDAENNETTRNSDDGNISDDADEAVGTLTLDDGGGDDDADDADDDDQSDEMIADTDGTRTSVTELQSLECDSSQVNAYPRDETALADFIWPMGENRDKKVECEECGKQFENKMLFRKHLVRSHSKVQCDKCKARFYEVEKYEMHPCMGPFKCKECDTEFESGMELKSHNQKLHAKDFNFVCSQCQKGFTFKSRYERHMLIHKTEKSYKCPDCLGSFQRPEFFRKHRRVCMGHNSKRIKCKHCPKVFSTNADLFRHIRLKHTTKPSIKCEYCSTTIASKYLYKKHLMFKHKKKLKYDCNACGESFSVAVDLFRHITICKNLQCSRCKRRFYHTPGYNRHIQLCGKITHIRKTKYVVQCDSCGIKFKQPHHLIRHGRLCSVQGGRCLKCDEYLPTVDKLSEHVSSRECETVQPETVQCEVCGKEFASKRKLSVHLRHVHRRQDKFFCEFCAKGFSVMSAYNYHIRLHLRKRNYACDKCGKQFICTRSLIEHECSGVADVKPLQTESASSPTQHRESNGTVEPGRETNIDELTPSGAASIDVICQQTNNDATGLETLEFDSSELCSVNDDKMELERYLGISGNNSEQESKFRSKGFSCVHCSNRRFVDKHGLRKHYIRAHPLVQCDKCKKKFIEVEKYETHLCLGEGTCKECDIRFDSAMKLKIHYQKVHQKYFDFMCELCNKGFLYKSKYERHMVQHTDENNSNQCRNCSKCFKNQRGLDRHVDNHVCAENHPNLTCQHCGKEFPSRAELFKHVRIRHAIKSTLKCEHCDITIPSQYMYNRHVQLKHPDKLKHECKICGKTFSFADDLIKHRDSCTGANLHCEKCKKRFYLKLNYEKHVQKCIEQVVETGPFKCPECPKVYQKKEYLRDHYKLVHSKQFNFLCTTCGKGFVVAGKYKTHLLVHLEKKFECDLCGRKYREARVLKSHMKTCKGPGFKCTKCDRVFNNEKERNGHVEFVHEKPHVFQCNICNSSLTSAKNLTNHKRLVHDIWLLPARRKNKPTDDDSKSTETVT